MFLKDFAEMRGVKPDTVATYIRRHPEIAALTSTEGYHMVLSEEAIDILDKKYPMPKPVQVIQDTESLKKLNDAQEFIIKLQEKMMQMAEENSRLAIQAEKVLMLEAAEQEKADRISKLEADIDRRDDLLDEEKQAHQNTASELADTQKQLADTQQELERMKNRSLWQRIFNK